MIDDPYSVLGLTPDASDEEVKRAYRALAKKYHFSLTTPMKDLPKDALHAVLYGTCRYAHAARSAPARGCPSSVRALRISCHGKYLRDSPGSPRRRKTPGSDTVPPAVPCAPSAGGCGRQAVPGSNPAEYARLRFRTVFPP